MALDEDLCRQVLEKLREAKSPLTYKEVIDIIDRLHDSEQDSDADANGDADAEPPPTPASMRPPPAPPEPDEVLPPPTVRTEETDQQRVIAGAAANGDIGGRAEIERLMARDEQLTRENKRLAESNAASK